MAAGFWRKRRTHAHARQAATIPPRRPARQINIQSGTHVAGQLQNTLDARKAKVGDQVVLKTTQVIKSDGHVVVNKGARSLGRVTSVEQKTGSSGQSQIGLLFDRLESGSLAVPITATISSITQAATHAQASQDDMVGSGTSTMTSSRSTATTQRSGGPQSGGGLLGGVTNNAGGVVNTTTSAVGGVASGATSGWARPSTQPPARRRGPPQELDDLLVEYRSTSRAARRPRVVRCFHCRAEIFDWRKILRSIW